MRTDVLTTRRAAVAWLCDLGKSGRLSGPDVARGGNGGQMRTAMRGNRRSEYPALSRYTRASIKAQSRSVAPRRSAPVRSAPVRSQEVSIRP